jgi:transcriptional regulator with XRE-family HTH domain
MATHLTAVQAPAKDATMPLGERIRQLRRERGWSQGDLATRLGGDPGQVSRYETGKISPSVDVVVKLAEAFDISADYLLIDGTARRPLHAPADLLGERLAQLDQLTAQDQAALIHILDHMLANNRARAALTGHAS